MEEMNDRFETYPSGSDVIRTSSYVSLENLGNGEPDYEGFAKAVTMAVDSLERNKYSESEFCGIISTLVDNYGIPRFHAPTSPDYYNNKAKSLGTRS